METLTKEFILPSNGVFGGPTKVSMRPMSGKEEKLMYTSRDDSFIEKIVKSCIVEPKDVNIDLFHPSDIEYLLYMLREMTFGPNYLQRMQCPHCTYTQDIEIDITEMTYYVLDLEELEKLSTITLPVSGDTIKIKLLSQGDLKDINSTIKRITKNKKLEDAEGYEYVYRYAKIIETINGEEKDIREVIDYLENINLKDFNEIKKTLTNIKIGIDTKNIRTCEKCGEEVEVYGVTVPEFFRSY